MHINPVEMDYQPQKACCFMFVCYFSLCSKSHPRPCGKGAASHVVLAKQFRLRVKMLQNRFLHELCHFSASVNSILPPNRYMFNILSFLMSVACTCMHTHTHFFRRSCWSFPSNSQNVFLQPSKHTTANHGKHNLLSVKKKTIYTSHK